MKKTDENSLKVGEIYESNRYGAMEVLEYSNSKNVVIKFVDTGNVYVTQKWAVITGMVQDVKERERLVLENAAAKESAILAAHAERAKVRREIEAAKQKAKEEKKALKMAKAQEKAEKEAVARSRLIGNRYKDNLGCEFEVVANAGGLRTWIVKYIETGNTYTVEEGWLVKGSVYDKNRSDYDVLYKRYQSAVAAAHYERNRERRIALASKYQKDNIERTRARNRLRRARRVGAEGSHTEDEVSGLYESQGRKCACCGQLLTEGSRHLDHIMPLSLGGSNYIENLQWLCQFCNSVKSDRHPDEWDLYRVSQEFAERLSARFN